jgi:hypothetical protein
MNRYNTAVDANLNGKIGNGLNSGIEIMVVESC